MLIVQGKHKLNEGNKDDTSKLATQINYKGAGVEENK